MKAMCIDGNRNFVWRDVDDPVCHDAFNVKIRVEACAINRADLMQRAGIYAPPEGWPLWPGLECAGEITEAPEGGRFKPGDRVCALLGGGGYAEQVVVPAGMCMPIPKGFETWEAAGIPEVYATAYLNLKIVGEIQRGETFFINGGEGGLGIACIQLAKHVFGAKVVAQVASDENGAFCKEVGADVVSNRFKDDLVHRDDAVSRTLDIARVHGWSGDDDRRKSPLAQEPASHRFHASPPFPRGEGPDTCWTGQGRLARF